MTAFSKPTILTGLVLSLALAGSTSIQAEQRPDRAPRPVLVQKIVYERSVPERNFVGTIRPRVESDFGFRIGGKVAQRIVNVGDTVKAGTPLATLDEIDLRLQMEQANAEVATARVGVIQADADLNRTVTLASKGWTAQASVDKQRSATEEARSRLLRAERALELAKNSFAYAVLTADADGVVTATSIEPGQVVSAGQASIRIAHTAEREAVIALPEAYVARARTGTARMSVWSSEGVVYAVTLRELSPAADPATRTFLARFSIPKADDKVRLGMTATVTLSEPNPEKLARVPMVALFDQGKGPSVWSVQADGQLKLTPVSVARYEGGDALVRGIEDGADIVRLGVHKLDTTQRVRAVTELSF